MSDDALVRAWEVLDVARAWLKAHPVRHCERCRAECRLLIEAIDILRRARAGGVLGPMPDGPAR